MYISMTNLYKVHNTNWYFAKYLYSQKSVIEKFVNLAVF